MEQETPRPLQQHQQDVFRRIRLPIFGATLFPLGIAILLIAGWATGNVTAQQVTCVAAGMAVIFLFIPLTLFLLMINFLTLWLAFGSSQIGAVAQPYLAKTREFSADVSGKTQTVSEKITEPVINIRAKVAYWRTMTLKGLDKVKPDETERQQN